MKILADQINHQIENFRHILIIGDDPYFSQTAISKIKSYFKKLELNNVLSFAFEKKPIEWSELALELNSPSLFGDRKCFNIRLRATLNKQDELEFDNILNNLGDNYLLVHINKLTKAQEKKSWVQYFFNQGLVVNAESLKPHQIASWIKQQMAAHQLSTSQDGYRLLALSAQNNMVSLANEIQKLSLLFKPGFISLDDIKNTISDHSQFNVFQCVDEALSQHPKKTLYILKHLKLSNTEPVILLWAILRELRQLASIRFYLNQDSSTLNQLFQQYKVWQSKKPIYQHLLENHSLSFFHHLIAEAKDIDAQIKGIGQGNVWLSLKQLLFKIAYSTNKQSAS